MLGNGNVRIQKSPRASAMVVHVDKIKFYRGDDLNSWFGESNERPMDRMEDGAITQLFMDGRSNRDTKIINDIEDDVDAEEKKKMPRRNATYIYAVSINSNVSNNDNADLCYRNMFQEVKVSKPRTFP